MEWQKATSAWEARMHHYRCYRLGFDGHIAAVSEIDCEDDATAIGRAWDLLSQGSLSGVELWQGVRLVGRIDRDEAATPMVLAGPEAAGLHLVH
jgi:hypothetical protein